MAGLNPKQSKFLKNYLEEGMSATDAYQDAYGCQRRWARHNASHLLTTNHNIIQAVETHEKLEEAATKRALHNKSERAAEVLGEALDSQDINARIRAARDILDRTGHKLKEEIDLEISSGNPAFYFGNKIAEDDI